MRFERLPPETLHAIERAASRFLAARRYIGLDEACQALGLTLPDPWNRLLQEADQPESEPLAFSAFF